MEKELLVFDTDAQMPVYTVTGEDMKRVDEIYRLEFPDNNLINSKTVYNRKRSRIAGILGEIIFQKLFPDALKSKDITYDFDWDNKKVDVKCKYRTVTPSLEYEASFFLYQTKEKFKADWYIFMSTIPSFKSVWICGFITKKDILGHPNMEIWRHGEIDKNNGMRFIEDTVCLKYKYLDNFEYKINEQIGVTDFTM